MQTLVPESFFDFADVDFDFWMVTPVEIPIPVIVQLAELGIADECFPYQRIKRVEASRWVTCRNAFGMFKERAQCKL